MYILIVIKIFRSAWFYFWHDRAVFVRIINLELGKIQLFVIALLSIGPICIMNIYEELSKGLWTGAIK